MSQERNREQASEQDNREYLYVGVGLILGSAVGFSIGGPVSAAIGAGVGLVIGAAIDANKNKQHPDF